MIDEIIEKWGLIEADFMREYRIDLVKELPAMSWRRFMVLVSGLSVNSHFYLSFQGQKTIEDPTAAERAVDRLWG